MLSRISMRRLARLAIASLIVQLGASVTSYAQSKVEYVLASGRALDQTFIATELGFFKAEGVEVNVVYGSSAQQAVQLISGGNADIFIGSLDPLVVGYEKGVRGKAIFFNRNRLPYFLAVSEDSPVKTVEDLAGKRIGIPTLASGTIPTINSTLKHHKVNPSQITLIPVGLNDQALAALKSGQVDALGLWDTMFWSYEKLGLSFRYLYHPVLSGFSNAGAIVGEHAIANKPDAICKVGRALAKASIFLNSNPEASLKIWWKANPTAMGAMSESEALKSALPAQRKVGALLDVGFPPEKKYGLGNKDAIARYVDMLREEGWMQTSPTVDDIYTEQFIDCISDFDGDAVREMAKAWKN